MGNEKTGGTTIHASRGQDSAALLREGPGSGKQVGLSHRERKAPMFHLVSRGRNLFETILMLVRRLKPERRRASRLASL